ncbi:uncharacterized protein LOC117653721 [Thrips palmi]|uniref:Uncharacterized protein LOC117653721 n=1 Tax=Thrips palmi TaxID=161013 RepID=A0A6P9AJ40_THRPL|nr:uncharacterized protein LOC117653721 [Thrips palmi]
MPPSRPQPFISLLTVRVFIGTLKAVAQIIKEKKANGERLVCPPRKSVGSHTFPVIKPSTSNQESSKRKQEGGKKKTVNAGTGSQSIKTGKTKGEDKGLKSVESKDAANDKTKEKIALGAARNDREAKIVNKFRPSLGSSTPVKPTSEQKLLLLHDRGQIVVSTYTQTDAPGDDGDILQACLESLKSENAALVLKNKELLLRNESLESEKGRLETMQKNLQQLCDALLNKDGTSNSTAPKKCRISTMKALVTEEPSIDVPSDMVYAGAGKLISRKRMAEVDTLRTVEGRLTAILNDILIEPSAFSFKEVDGKSNRIMDIHLEAIHSYLDSLTWKKTALKPIKVGKQMVEPHTPEYTRRIVSKLLSKLGPSKKETDTDVKSGKKGPKLTSKRQKGRDVSKPAKRVRINPLDSSSSEDEEGEEREVVNEEEVVERGVKEEPQDDQDDEDNDNNFDVSMCSIVSGGDD